jgi:hypothetical protein
MGGRERMGSVNIERRGGRRRRMGYAQEVDGANEGHHRVLLDAAVLFFVAK